MILRSTGGVFAALLVLFAAVQYNDPDAAFWIAVYGVGAAWCALAALVPRRLAHPGVGALLALSIALAVTATFYFWPSEPGFWRRDVWWESETAREGMGMMVLALFLIVPVLAARRSANRSG